MKIKNFKMKVTPEQSVKVQKVIFENGGSWRDGRKEIIRYLSQYFFYENEELTVSDYDYYMDKELPLLTYEQFMQLYSKQPEPKKYKLIMWYPGLPDNWKHEDIVVEKEDEKYPTYKNKKYRIKIYCSEVENNPEYWQEIEQTKFMAEDGVEINEGDVCYAVNKKTYIVVRCYFGEVSLEKYLYFKNSEAAEKYIQVYNPKYSLNDIVNSFPFPISEETGRKILDNLKKLNK